MFVYRKCYSCEIRIVFLVEDFLYYDLFFVKLKVYGLNEEVFGLLGLYFCDCKIEKSLVMLLVIGRRLLDVVCGDCYWVYFFEMFFFY